MVSELAAEGGAAAPFSLYLEIEKGKVANMEVVARASIAFVDLVKEVAFIIDPTLDVQVQLQSGTEGSLFLNTLIRDLKDPAKRKRTLKAIAIALLIFLGPDIKSWVVSKVLDEATESEEGFSKEEKKEIEEIIRRAVKDNVAADERQQLFRELERDPVIKGVGGSTNHQRVPGYIIPRSEFPLRAGAHKVEETETSRTRLARRWIRLVSPVLTHERRRWKFAIGETEYGVYIADGRFLEDVLSGRATLPMIEGIELDVTIQLHEQLVGEDWKLVGHQTVTQVHGMQARKQEELRLPFKPAD
jgi:hypothetical protein